MSGMPLTKGFVLATSLAALVVLSGCTTTLACRNDGAQQVVAKEPFISIKSGPALKAGRTIQWTSTDNDKGEIVLTKPLTTDPNDEVRGYGHPGNNYQCTAVVKP